MMDILTKHTTCAQNVCHLLHLKQIILKLLAR